MTGRDTDYIREDRAARVVEQFDVVEHPNNPDLFVSEERAEQIDADDEPAVDRKDYADLSREEKVVGIRVALARNAEHNGGKAAFGAGTIKRELFDNRPSDGHVQQLMELAGEADGFGMGSKPTDGAKRVVADLPAVSEAILDLAGVDHGPEHDDGVDGRGGESEGDPTADGGGSDVRRRRRIRA